MLLASRVPPGAPAPPPVLPAATAGSESDGGGGTTPGLPEIRRGAVAARAGAASRCRRTAEEQPRWCPATHRIRCGFHEDCRPQCLR